MNRKVLKIKGSKKVFKATGEKTYIAQKTNGSIDISKYPENAEVPEDIFKLEAPVLLTGSEGAILLGPGINNENTNTSIQYYGETGIATDLLSLYQEYKEKGLNAFKRLLGGRLFSVVVNPILEDILSDKGVNFTTLLTASVPTDLHRIENKGSYSIDIYSTLMSQRYKPKNISSGKSSSEEPQEASPVILENKEEDEETLEPSTWRDRPITPRQKTKLQELGIPIDPAWRYGDASDQIKQRGNYDPAASARQIKLLASFGVDIPDGLTRKEASTLIVETKKKKGLN